MLKGQPAKEWYPFGQVKESRIVVVCLPIEAY